MSPDSNTHLATLKTMLSNLLDILQTQSATSNSDVRREAIKDIVELLVYYRTVLETAMRANDVAGALKAANGAVGVNKGLADQGARIADDPQLRALGVAISNEGLHCAKLLRADLGLSY